MKSKKESTHTTSYHTGRTRSGIHIGEPDSENNTKRVVEVHQRRVSLHTKKGLETKALEKKVENGLVTHCVSKVRTTLVSPFSSQNFQRSKNIVS